ncbi:MAG: hypothetical protein KJ732_01385 [Candidatus Margulisbacteria bacterium]|nr:hypothetical protein [Candidatus Margulisiibacteriota bacterium]
MVVLGRTVRVTPQALESIVRKNRVMIHVEGRNIRMAQTVLWGAVAGYKSIQAEIKGKQLVLSERDYRGNPTAEQHKLRILQLMNSDIRELVMPQDFLYGHAERLIEEVGSCLLLKIKGAWQSGRLISGQMSLVVGTETAEEQTYGLLILND